MEIKDRIQEHFDQITPYYLELWGQHIHHGYWRDGTETKKQAQIQLIDELARRISLKQGVRILDVGCGVGGTALYLAEKYSTAMTGITISPVQVDTATRLAKEAGVQATFLQMDGEDITLETDFDVIWTVEVISHYLDKENFFRHASRLCRPGGRVAMGVWLKAEHLSPEQEEKYIAPIESGMLLPGLCTLHDYLEYLNRYGFRLLSAEDVTQHVAETWDLCLDIVSKPDLWRMAYNYGSDVIRFMKAFKAMRAGCRSRSFVYGLIAAERI